MKEEILQAIKNGKCLTGEEILKLNEQNFINSEFKSNLIKDKLKNDTSSKIYVKYGQVYIKFEYDDAF